ncbi:TPA: hypothetical protein SML70_005024 [Serratia marcescens]|nr:hypothetical protein [Serratia marcescens]
MGKYKLDLYANAIDSLNEALLKYELGLRGEARAHKFVLLHFCHFMELTLKAYLWDKNENLIYSKVYKEIKKEAKKRALGIFNTFELLESESYDFSRTVQNVDDPYTITMDDAIEFIYSEGELDDELVQDIKAIKKIRNNIEHYAFEMDTKQIRLTIGRLMRGFYEFTDYVGLGDLNDAVHKQNIKIFEMLADEYESKLQEAHADVREAHSEAFRGVRFKEYNLVDWNCYICDSCGEETMIPNHNSPTGYECTHCGATDSGNIEVECDVCSTSWPKDEMDYWDGVGNLCPCCTDFDSKP